MDEDLITRFFGMAFASIIATVVYKAYFGCQDDDTNSKYYYKFLRSQNKKMIENKCKFLEVVMPIELVKICKEYIKGCSCDYEKGSWLLVRSVITAPDGKQSIKYIPHCFAHGDF
jgi:hypothetical protein